MSRILYSQTIDEQFPTVKFQGGSSIHRSVNNYVVWQGSNRATADTKAKDVILGDAGRQIWMALRSQFKGVSWLMIGQELQNMLNVDFIRHLYGEGSSFTKNRLKNPHTGNYFHLVAIKDQTVCGVRVWVMGDTFSYRFRLEQKFEAEAETRKRSAAAVLDYDLELLKIKDGLGLTTASPELVAQKQELWAKFSEFKSKQVQEDDDDEDDDDNPF